MFTFYKLSVAGFSLSLAIQVTATTLIVWKIAVNTIWSSMTSHKEHLAVIWIIVESGAILTVTTIVLCTLYLLEMNTGQIMSNIMGQLGLRASIIVSLSLLLMTYSFQCLVPTLIIVRVGMKRTDRLHRGPAGLAYGSNTAILVDQAVNDVALEVRDLLCEVISIIFDCLATAVCCKFPTGRESTSIRELYYTYPARFLLSADISGTVLRRKEASPFCL